MNMYVIILEDENGNKGLYDRMYNSYREAEEDFSEMKKTYKFKYSYKIKKIFIRL